MISKLIFVLLILLPGMLLSQQQKKYCSGVVKEDIGSKVAPVYNQEVWLTHFKNDHQPYPTDNFGKFFFYTIPSTGDHLEVPLNREYRLLDSACLRFEWSENANFLTNIYIKRNELIQSQKASYNYTNSMRASYVKVKIKKIRYQPELSLVEAEQKTDRKREAFFNYQERLNLFSDVYATSIFPLVDSGYAKAFQQFQYSEDEAVGKTLNESLLGQGVPSLPSLVKLRATAHIMKGVVLDTGYTDFPGLYYTKALYVDTQAYTISSYANYLVDANRFKESIPFLKLKLSIDSSVGDFTGRIYTLGQLVRAYDSLLTITDSSLIYAELIDRYTREIINSKEQPAHSSWIVGHKKVIRYKFERANRFPKRRNKRTYIRSLFSLEKYFNNQFKTNTDQEIFWIADQSEQTFKIAVAYDSLLHRYRKASKYYEKAIKVAYEQTLATPDKRYVEVLKERYRAYFKSSFYPKRKSKFIAAQLKELTAATALPPAVKSELQNDLNTYNRSFQ